MAEDTVITHCAAKINDLFDFAELHGLTLPQEKKSAISIGHKTIPVVAVKPVEGIKYNLSKYPDGIYLTRIIDPNFLGVGVKIEKSWHFIAKKKHCYYDSLGLNRDRFVDIDLSNLFSGIGDLVQIQSVLSQSCGLWAIYLYFMLNAQNFRCLKKHLTRDTILNGSFAVLSENEVKLHDYLMQYAANNEIIV